MEDSVPLRSVGPKAAHVLEELALRRRRSIRLPEDEVWIRNITDHPIRLLSRMESRGLLYRIRNGRYVVAPRGTFSVEQAAPVDLIVDLELSAQGDYFISYLSALIGHRLTDLHTSNAFAAIRQESKYRGTLVELPSCKLHVVRLSQFRWPSNPTLEEERERVRVLSDAKEFVWRATIERTLIDSLTRPDLSAGIETVISAWTRAQDRDTDWDLLCSIAEHQGVSTVRRTSYLLRLLGMEVIAKKNFQGLIGRSARVPLDRSASFNLPNRDMTRDPLTGVVVNIPEDHLRGWVEGARLQ